MLNYVVIIVMIVVISDPFIRIGLIYYFFGFSVESEVYYILYYTFIFLDFKGVEAIAYHSEVIIKVEFQVFLDSISEFGSRL